MHNTHGVMHVKQAVSSLLKFEKMQKCSGEFVDFKAK